MGVLSQRLYKRHLTKKLITYPGPHKIEGGTNSLNTSTASNLLMQSANQWGNFVLFFLSVLIWMKVHQCLPLRNPPIKEQIFTSEIGLQSLVPSSFVQSNTLDEFRNSRYIINFYMVWTFFNVLWQMQLKLFQVQTSYKLTQI